MNAKISYPVPALAASLERDWAARLAKRAGTTETEFLAAPSRYMNFPIEEVRIELMDGSEVRFKYAFAIVDEQVKAIAVFTEHCGHHVLPFHEAKVYEGGELVWSHGAV